MVTEIEVADCDGPLQHVYLLWNVKLQDNGVLVAKENRKRVSK